MSDEWVQSSAPVVLFASSRVWRAEGSTRYRAACNLLLCSWFGNGGGDRFLSLRELCNSLGRGYVYAFRVLKMIDAALAVSRNAVPELPSTDTLLKDLRNENGVDYSKRYASILTRNATALAGGAALLLHLLAYREHGRHLCKWEPDFDIDLWVGDDRDVLVLGGIFMARLSDLHGMGMETCEIRLADGFHTKRLSDQDLRKYATRATQHNKKLGNFWQTGALAIACMETLTLQAEQKQEDPHYTEEYSGASLLLDIKFVGGGQTMARSEMRLRIICHHGDEIIEEPLAVIDTFDIDVCACAAVRSHVSSPLLHLFSNVTAEQILGP